jgi:hypothetical protein
MPWVDMSINWDGTISACIIDYNESHVLGDANTTSLHDIWNGPGYRKFRQSHLSGDFDWIEKQGPLCASCSLIYDPAYQEYDLLDMKEFATNYIMRQADVLAERPPLEVAAVVQSTQYKTCVLEFEKFDHIVRTLDRRSATDVAKSLRSHNLRSSAIANAPSRREQSVDAAE